MWQYPRTGSEPRLACPLPPQIRPDTCTGASHAIDYIEWVIASRGEEEGALRPLNSAAAPEGIHIDAVNVLRAALFCDAGPEHVRAVDDLLTGPEGFDYLQGDVFKSVYESLCGAFPAGCRSSGTKEMRVDMLKMWSAKMGPFRLQIQSAMGTKKLGAWLINSEIGAKPTPGHAFQRLLGLAISFYSHMDEAEKSIFPTYEPCAISSVILQRLGQFAAGAKWDEVYRMNIAAPMGEEAEEWLSDLLDMLPYDVQLLITTLEMPDGEWRVDHSPLFIDTSSRNKSVQQWWKLVRANIKVFIKALNSVCTPLEIGAGGAAAGATDMSVIAEALTENSSAALMSHAAYADQAEAKATSSGDIIEKVKLVALCKSDSPKSVSFRASMQQAIDAESEQAGLEILLKNPDAGRLLMVKISPSIASTSKYLQYIVSMRNFIFMKVEKLFASKHGGRFSHAAAAKLVTRALKLEDAFWSGAFNPAHISLLCARTKDRHRGARRVPPSARLPLAVALPRQVGNPGSCWESAATATPSRSTISPPYSCWPKSA